MRTQIHPVSPPAGYPFELERDMVLSNGSRAHLRPIVPEDADVIADEILTADSETLYMRFFTTSVRPDDEMLERLTVLDYQTALAVGLLELDTGESMGIARYAAIDETTVEVAVSVKPEWRRVGVARALLDVVESAAADRGYQRCVALYLTENRAADELFAERGYTHSAAERGVLEVQLDLNRQGARA